MKPVIRRTIDFPLPLADMIAESIKILGVSWPQFIREAAKDLAVRTLRDRELIGKGGDA